MRAAAGVAPGASAGGGRSCGGVDGGAAPTAAPLLGGPPPHAHAPRAAPPARPPPHALVAGVVEGAAALAVAPACPVGQLDAGESAVAGAPQPLAGLLPHAARRRGQRLRAVLHHPQA